MVVLTRRKVVLGVVVLLCVAILGYVMYTKGDKEEDTKDKTTTDDTPKSDSKGSSLGYIGVVALIGVVVAVVAYVQMSHAKNDETTKYLTNVVDQVTDLKVASTEWTLPYGAIQEGADGAEYVAI
jgi:flagellar basal body-associated protein FliL